MLLGNHWPTGKFPILRSLVYVHHPVEVAGIELPTFGLRDTTTTMSPPILSSNLKSHCIYIHIKCCIFLCYSCTLFYWTIMVVVFQIAPTANRAAAMASVFILSALFHEYILAISFGFFYPVLFLMFAGIGCKSGDEMQFNTYIPVQHCYLGDKYTLTR